MREGMEEFKQVNSHLTINKTPIGQDRTREIMPKILTFFNLSNDGRGSSEKQPFKPRSNSDSDIGRLEK
jgi:hypothetical protein